MRLLNEARSHWLHADEVKYKFMQLYVERNLHCDRQLLNMVCKE